MRVKEIKTKKELIHWLWSKEGKKHKVPYPQFQEIVALISDAAHKNTEVVKILITNGKRRSERKSNNRRNK